MAYQTPAARGGVELPTLASDGSTDPSRSPRWMGESSAPGSSADHDQPGVVGTCDDRAEDQNPLAGPERPGAHLVPSVDDDGRADQVPGHRHVVGGLDDDGRAGDGLHDAALERDRFEAAPGPEGELAVHGAEQ